MYLSRPVYTAVNAANPARGRPDSPSAPSSRTTATCERLRYLDLRTLPSAARTWLNTARPTYDAGTVFKKGTTLTIGQAYDVLIHLHQVRETDKL
ncbi:hypothetical protein [Streptomyces colonosanans]|uniref:hypothetical protein n=1 Tax=Streptomyces colonosanans TaxID=1428652 RepID=UPI0015A6CE95|nr:hypothetical protein [Streptomyces colonosanans]